jgi:hypothetical protein
MALVVFFVRGHPAPEHTRAFHEEDHAARTLLLAARDHGKLDDALAILGARRAWVTVHDPARSDRTAAVADLSSLGPIASDAVLQVDVEIEAPLGASSTWLDWRLDPGLDGAILSAGDVQVPGALLARGMDRGRLAIFFAKERASVLRTYAVVETRAGPKRLLLGALLPEPPVTGERLVAAAALGGRYLVTHQNGDGRFDYEIDASTGMSTGGYNILRHAGTTYALLQLHRQRASIGSADDLDAALLSAGDQGLQWLTTRTEDDPHDASRAFVEDGKKVKLGGSALALLAMVERLAIPNPPPGLRETAGKLARFLVAQQDENGRFASYATPSPDHVDEGRDSIYYPGEAVLALARFDAIAGDDAHPWRAAAEHGARYLVNDRHRALGLRVRVPVDAWLVLAIEELDREQGRGRLADDDELLAHAQRITRQIMREMHTANTVPLPMRGARADYGFGSLISIGSRMEALGAAAALEARRDSAAHRVRDAATANAAYGMRFQITEDRLFLTAAQARALGGVPTSVTDPRVRIDGVQHNLSGWLLLAAVLDQRPPP